MSVLVIAEPGCTHEGDKAALLQLLETAHAAGADCFKPQWVSDPAKMCERRHIGTTHPKRAYYETAYGWLQWPVDWHAEFWDRCHVLGMQYAVSVYLPEDVATVAPVVDYLKISSFEAHDAELLAEANAHKLRVILSTGMGYTDPSRPDMQYRAPWALLHCVSAYPAPLSAMNLRVLRTMPGLSDHSRHVLTGAVAVGAGAKIIETHYRLDTCHPSNPDYAVAFTPAEFTAYIDNIRTAETMLGDGVKKRQPCEDWALPYRVSTPFGEAQSATS